MSLVEHPVVGRAAALTILGTLVVLFCVGPLAAYWDLVAGNNDELATKQVMLQRYRALASTGPSPAVPATPVPLYPDVPDSQASALLQETVKNSAAAAHVQVQGLQVLRSETVGGATRIGVRVRGSGDVASLRNLLYAVETARPLLYPDNLRIQGRAPSSDTTPGPLDLQLDISGFKADPES